MAVYHEMNGHDLHRVGEGKNKAPTISLPIEKYFLIKYYLIYI